MVRKTFSGSNKKGNTLYNSPIVSHLLSHSLKQMIDAWLIAKISILPLLNYANNILFNIPHKARIEQDSTTSDIQLLCKLWSGESTSYHFVTEATQEIDSNTAFSVLGKDPK